MWTGNYATPSGYLPLVESTDLCFVMSGMGQGTGNGATTVVVEVPKELGGHVDD